MKALVARSTDLVVIGLESAQLAADHKSKGQNPLCGRAKSSQIGGDRRGKLMELKMFNIHGNTKTEIFRHPTELLSHRVVNFSLFLKRKKETAVFLWIRVKWSFGKPKKLRETNFLYFKDKQVKKPKSSYGEHHLNWLQNLQNTYGHQP